MPLVIPEYYTDMTDKRLNKRGRALFAVKFRLEGMEHQLIALALNIPQERLHRLYGEVVGLLGYFDMYEKGTQAELILTLHSQEIKVKTEILIAKYGDKIFTKAPLPVKGKKKKKEKYDLVPVKVNPEFVRDNQYHEGYKVVREDYNPEGFEYFMDLHGTSMVSTFPSGMRCFVLMKVEK